MMVAPILPELRVHFGRGRRFRVLQPAMLMCRDGSSVRALRLEPGTVLVSRGVVGGWGADAADVVCFEDPRPDRLRPALCTFHPVVGHHAVCVYPPASHLEPID